MTLCSGASLIARSMDRGTDGRWSLRVIIRTVSRCGNRAGSGLALAAAAIAMLVAAPSAPASTAVTQPPQPESGPGGSDYAHDDWRVSAGGEGADAWFTFEPVKPRPKKAPLAVIMHGYYEFAGYDSMYELIRHTVRQGNVVIYPRWQTGTATPCPGPFDIEPCIDSAGAGIDGGLDHLRSSKKRVRPDLKRASYLGFSFGAIVTANMTNRYVELGLPKPRAIFLEDPHDGGLDGQGEPALDDDLSGIPPKTLVQCHSSADGVVSRPEKETSSCNAVFPKLGSIPAKNKDLVMALPDDHGGPALTAEHGVCAAAPGQANAYDWNFCWKVWDAMRDCAYAERHCKYALGDTARHRSNGEWSDGTPIAPLKIREKAPIQPPR